MWSSHLKFEHAQQHPPPGGGPGPDQPDFTNPSFHQLQPQAMPSTPTHHRRGQSLTIDSAPRTPHSGHPSLRPPVYLQSPMGNHTPGLMGVGDVFSPPSGGFHDNMGYYSPVLSSPGTALDHLNEDIANFDLASFGGPLPGDSLFESPMPSPGQAPPVLFNTHNPFTSPPESFIPPRTASPMTHGMPQEHQHQHQHHNGGMGGPPMVGSYIRTPQASPTRHPFRDSIISTPDPSPTHHNPLKDSLIQARQPSPTRDSFCGMDSLIRTPDPSPTRHSFSHHLPGSQHSQHHQGMNPLHTAPDLRPTLTPRGSSRSPNRSRQSPSPSRRMRAHQRTQSLASINSVMSLADGDMEQYRVESNVKPEQISELIGETDGPATADGTPSDSTATPAATGTASTAGAAGATDSNNKKFICKWTEPSTKEGEADKVCGQFFERKENCKAHIQTHLDDRQYKCPYGFCGKLFVRSHDLRRHLRTHDVHKKWVCPCGRDFSRADALHRHQGRGNCIGAPPGTKRKEPAKRGRPPKKKEVVGGGDGTLDGAAAAAAAVLGGVGAGLMSEEMNLPPQPTQGDGDGGGNSASFAPMGGYDHHDHDHDNHHGGGGGFDEDMTGMMVPDFATDPSPSPNSGGLAPSPLEDELSSSPMPPQHADHLLEPTGDEWLEDLIFINDDNFVDSEAV